MQNASLDNAYDVTPKCSVLVKPPAVMLQDIKTEEDVVTELLKEASASHKLNLPADGRIEQPEICAHSELPVDLASKPMAGCRGWRRWRRAKRHFPAQIPLTSRTSQQLDSNVPSMITTSWKRPCQRSVSQQIRWPPQPNPAVTSNDVFQPSPPVFLSQHLLTVASDQMGGVLSTALPGVTLCTSRNDLLLNGIPVRVITDNAEPQVQQPLGHLQQMQSLVQCHSIRTHPSNSFLAVPANQTSAILSSASPVMHSVTLGPPSGNNHLRSGIPVIVGDGNEVPLTDVTDDAPKPRANSAHSAVERLYRTRINSRIAQLGELVCGKDLKQKKSAVLQKTIEYIGQLQTENQRLKEENKTLRLALHKNSGFVHDYGIEESAVATGTLGTTATKMAKKRRPGSRAPTCRQILNRSGDNSVG